MTELTPEQREALLAPCVCGHTINEHGSLVACWLCDDEGGECSVTFEALLAERIAAMLAEAREEALGVAEASLGKVVDYWDGRPTTHHGDHIYADLRDIRAAIQRDRRHNARSALAEEGDR